MSVPSLFPVKSVVASGDAGDSLHGKNALTFKHMVETTVDQTPQITKMNQDKRRAERMHAKQRKKLSSTVETEHLPAVTVASTQAGHISDDSFDAFRNAKKIPTLRNTPALIVWPQRPDGRSVDNQSCCSQTRLTVTPQHPYNKNKALPQESQIIGDNKFRKSKQNSELPDINEYQKRNSRKNTYLAYNYVDEVTRTREVSVVIAPPKIILGNNEQDDETDLQYKPVADYDFWANTGSNLRIDSLGIGTPRPDPYHSTWRRDERRCFFLSPLSKPPHIREPFFRLMKKIPPKKHTVYVPYFTPYTTTGKKSSLRKSLTSDGEQSEAEPEVEKVPMHYGFSTKASMAKAKKLIQLPKKVESSTNGDEKMKKSVLS